MTEKWKITHKPNPEFNGYPWHEPSTDPTQYHIVLESDVLSQPIAVLWPSGEVWMEDLRTDEGDALMIGSINEYGDVLWRLVFTNYLSKKEIQEIVKIVKYGFEEWKKLEEPEFSTLRPPIRY